MPLVFSTYVNPSCCCAYFPIVVVCLFFVSVVGGIFSASSGTVWHLGTWWPGFVHLIFRKII